MPFPVKVNPCIVFGNLDPPPFLVPFVYCRATLGFWALFARNPIPSRTILVKVAEIPLSGSNRLLGNLEQLCRCSPIFQKLVHIGIERTPKHTLRLLSTPPVALRCGIICRMLPP